MSVEEQSVVKKEQRSWWKFLVAALFVVFFIAYSTFAFMNPGRFTSPDEASNAFWAESFQTSSRLWLVYPPGEVLGPVVHPRSMRVLDGVLVPGGFLGLPIVVGVVGKIFVGAMPYVTPFFGVLGALCCGLLVWKATGRRVLGMLMAFLVVSDPVWWYWSSRSFMPNILAVSLGVIAGTVLVLQPLGKRWLNMVLSGLCFAVGFAVRPMEMVWFVLGGVIVAIVYKKLPHWKDVVLWMLSAGVFMVPFLFFNFLTFGSVFGTGYGSLEILTSVSGASSGLLGWLFPLSFVPKIALMNAWNYLVVLFPVWSLIFFGCSLVVVYGYVKKWFTEREERFLRAWFFVSMILGVVIVLFYGSAVLGDNPRVGAITIGVSYTRYWLPLYVLSVVPVAFVGMKILDWMRKKSGRLVNVVAVIFMLVVGGYAGWVVWKSPDEGLLHVNNALLQNAAKAEKVFAATEINSLIFTARGDKFLFPKRQVVTLPLSDASAVRVVEVHLDDTPMYYLGFTFNDDALSELNIKSAAEHGYVLELLQTFDSESLYVLKRYGD